MKFRATLLIAAGISSLISIAAPARAAAAESKSQITILYDAFGTDPSMTKDWASPPSWRSPENESCLTPGMTPTSLQPMRGRRELTSKRLISLSCHTGIRTTWQA
jgi:hypothetical protein